MKHRVKLALMTVLISIAGLGLMVAQNWRDTTRTIVVTIPTALSQPADVTSTVADAPTTQPAMISVEQTPTISDDTTTMHTAVRGETLSGLANSLRNKESKAYQEAIINANPSLKSDPNKLIAGKTYIIPAAANVPTAEIDKVEPTAIATATAATPVSADSTITTPAPAELNYTAKSGDTVSNMAGAFLGNADKAHQDTITNANASLKADPNHLVAGQAYKIPVPDGLTAAAVDVKADVRPAMQPDADSMVTTVAPKMLRYTAKAGDTLTSMAVTLLGSDSTATRQLIINTNPSLKIDPDKVVAGQIYTIPAPHSDAQRQ